MGTQLEKGSLGAWEPALLRFTPQRTVSSTGSHLDVHLQPPSPGCLPQLPWPKALHACHSSLAYVCNVPQWALPMLPSCVRTLFSIAGNCCGEGNKGSWYVSGNAMATFFPMHQRAPLPRPSQAQASRGLGNWPWAAVTCTRLSSPHECRLVDLSSFWLCCPLTTVSLPSCDDSSSSAKLHRHLLRSRLGNLVEYENPPEHVLNY